MKFVFLNLSIFYILLQTICTEKLPIPFSNININLNDLKSIAGVYSKPKNSPNNARIIFLCSGILIHSQVVLIEKSCLPTNSSLQNIVVQVSNWSMSQPEKIVFVSRIEKIQVDSNFTILFMTEKIGNDWVTDSYKMNTSIDQPCIYLDMQELNHGLTCDAYLTTYLSEEKCCNIFGDFHIHFENKKFQYQCQNHPNNFCANVKSDQCFHKGKQGSPILCPSMNDNTTYAIAGLLIDNDGCDYHFAKIVNLEKRTKELSATCVPNRSK